MHTTSNSCALSATRAHSPTFVQTTSNSCTFTSICAHHQQLVRTTSIRARKLPVIRAHHQQLVSALMSTASNLYTLSLFGLFWTSLHFVRSRLALPLSGPFWTSLLYMHYQLELSIFRLNCSSHFGLNQSPPCAISLRTLSSRLPHRGSLNFALPWSFSSLLVSNCPFAGTKNHTGSRQPRYWAPRQCVYEGSSLLQR